MKLDRDALDAELARLKEDATVRPGDDMPRYQKLLQSPFCSVHKVHNPNIHAVQIL